MRLATASGFSGWLSVFAYTLERFLSLPSIPAFLSGPKIRLHYIRLHTFRYLPGAWLGSYPLLLLILLDHISRHLRHTSLLFLDVLASFFLCLYHFVLPTGSFLSQSRTYIRKSNTGAGVPGWKCIQSQPRV
jgi:hypothetical protein